MKSLLLPYRPALVLSALLSIAGTACGLVPYLVVYAVAIEATDGSLSTDSVLVWAGIAFAAIVGKVGLNTLANTLSHRTAYQFLYELRVLLVEKLDRVPLGLFSARTTADLKKTINEDVEQIEEAIAHAIPDVATALAVPFVSAALLAFVDWRLALLALAMFPLIVVIYPLALAATRTLGAEYSSALVALHAATLEYIQGMRVIRAFLATGAVPSRFAAAVDRMAVATYRLSEAALAPGALLTIGLRANILVLLPAGGLLWIDGSVSTPTLVLFLLMGLGMNAPAQKLIITAGTFAMRMSTAGKAISAILDTPDLPVPAAPLRPAGYAVSFRDVSFRYGEDEGGGVSGVSFEAPVGTVTAIVGPSGAGKTTLARLLCRFHDVSAGSITLGGVDLRAIAPQDLLASISFILQDAWLFTGTIRDNIRAGRPDASDAEIAEAARRARVDLFAATLPQGLDSPVGEGGRGLSGGQRQRVAIARALLRAAPVVVLDEATSALDPENEAEVMEALHELARGRTVIAIAHRLNTVRSADQILYMEDGRVVDSGPHAALLTRCLAYARLCDRFDADEGWTLNAGPQTGSVPTPAPTPAPTLTPTPASARDQAGRAAGTPGEEDPPIGGQNGVSVFLSLLGPMRSALLTRALPLLFLEGLFMGAPVLATVATLLDGTAGTLTAASVWLYTGMVLASFLLQGLFNVLAHRVLWRIQTTAAPRLQHRIGTHLRRVPLGILTRRETGALETLITRHVTELNMVLPPAQMMRAVVAPLVSLAVLMVVDWRLALAVAATIPAFLLVVSLSDRLYRAIWSDLLASREDLSARLIDHLQGVATLRAFGMGGMRHRALAVALEHHRRVSLATVLRLSPTMAFGVSVLDLGFCAILLVGGLLTATGSLSLPLFLLVLVVGLVFYGPILDAFDLVAARRQQDQTIQRIREVLSLPVLPEPVSPGSLSLPENLEITFDHVGFSWDGDGEGAALRDVSLTLAAGSLHAFVGPSGSGKTTALTLLARFQDVDQGAIRIGGVDLRTLEEEVRAGLFSIVFQDTFLFDDTVAGNLRVARPGITEAEMIAAATAARCHEFIMALPEGYETRVGEGGGRLSGGERQRLAIARAILKGAPVVLLDEATASVDPETSHDIRTALASLCVGKTVVVVAHRLSSVRHADQIVVFDQGRITGCGRYDALLQDCATFRRLAGRELAPGTPEGGIPEDGPPESDPADSPPGPAVPA